MARTSFSRTVVKTHCDVRFVDQNNDIQTKHVVLFGNYNDSTAYNAVKKVLNAKGVIIDKITHESYYGTMTLENFDKYSNKTNHKEW